jgi:hypothetical protein
MNCNSMQLYAQMQKELNELKTCCNNEILFVEQCFNIAIHYWNKIKTYPVSFTFIQPEEEINFFKNIKPLFTAVIEYYTLHYQAILFKPTNDRHQLIVYWTHELKRVDLYFSKHRDFYHYYLTGQTNKDSDYFTRKKNNDNALKKSTHHSKPICYDDIAARIIAYQQYNDYAALQLKMLLPENKRSFFMDHYPAI